ncbi:flavin reductase family protein [Shimia sp.]|uniref:flavin reductase family protein n=1 Tax=Shimia sp. TaxID=1954381 RepID=UPI003B8BF240
MTAQTFVPTPENERHFRDALGCFATGVTIVTVPTADGPLGMTANSFSSVSLDPPLILWCPARNSERHPHFAGASHFAIHMLRDDQSTLAMEFARNGDPFANQPYQSNPHGVPLIDNCLARLECSTHAVHNGGDHDIVVGKVERLWIDNGAPLIFAQSNFGRFLPNA